MFLMFYLPVARDVWQNCFGRSALIKENSKKLCGLCSEVDLEADVRVQTQSCYFRREKGNYWGCAVERNLVDKPRRSH